MKVEAIASAEGSSKAMLVLPYSADVPDALADRPATERDGERVVRIGPRRWLVLAEHAPVSELIDAWRVRLAAVTHLALDASARLVALRVTGAEARRRVAEQTSSALSSESAMPRTLLGDVPVVVCVRGDDQVDVLVDRSVCHYAREWLERALE